MGGRAGSSVSKMEAEAEEEAEAEATGKRTMDGRGHMGTAVSATSHNKRGPGLAENGKLTEDTTARGSATRSHLIHPTPYLRTAAALHTANVG